MSIPVFFALMLATGALVGLIWWGLFKALLSHRHTPAPVNPFEGEVTPVPRSPLSTAKASDWQKALRESTSSEETQG